MKSAAGHVYFSLKDESASVRCAMFRMQINLWIFFKDGMQIPQEQKLAIQAKRRVSTDHRVRRKKRERVCLGKDLNS